MAKKPTVRSGNEVIVGGSDYAGPGRPVTEGSLDKPSGYTNGLPVNDTVVRRLNGTGSRVPGSVKIVEPDWGPNPEPSEAV